MSVFLFWDTETTGLIDYRLPLSDPSQPRIVQLGAVLTDATGNSIEEIDTLIKPDGWVIPEEVSKLHGITTERCEAEGIPMPDALARFNALKARCTHRVAYNISFDKQMMAREELAYGIEHFAPEGMQSICALQTAKRYVKLPPTERMLAAGRRGNKPPKLQESYKHFFGEEFANAHSALDDVRATVKIFFHMLELEKKSAA